jgi:hypothetical protein
MDLSGRAMGAPYETLQILQLMGHNELAIPGHSQQAENFFFLVVLRGLKH